MTGNSMTADSVRKHARPLKILATVAVSILIGLFLVEAMVRLTGLDVPRVWEPEPMLGWHHIPGARRHLHRRRRRRLD